MKSKVIYKLLIFLLSHQFLMAQDTFSKVYDLEDVGFITGREVDVYDDYLYVLTGKICPNPSRECGDIIKLDLEGNIIWKKEIGAIDIGNTNAISISNDTITITGHRNTVDQPIAFFMQQINVEGDSLRTFTIPIDTNIIVGAFNYGTFYVDNHFYFYGSGRSVDGSIDGIIIQIDKKGEVENTLYWDDGYKEMHPADLQLRSDGSLILMCEIVDFDSSVAWRSYIQLDEDLNRSYIWSSQVAFNLGVLNNLSVLKENKIAMISPNAIVGLSNKAPYVHFIDDNEIEYARYEFNFDQEVDIRRFTSNIVTASNGDVIGIGHYMKQSEGEKGFIFRISDAGQLLWETTYRSEDWNTGGQLLNQLNDVVELEDGSLFAVGWQNETIDNQSLRDLWVLRVTSHGCLSDEICDFGQFTTSANNHLTKENKRLNLFYPNPNSGTIYFTENIIPHSKMEVFSTSGERLQCFDEIIPNTSISFLELNSGIYILKFISPDLRCHYQKMVLK